MKDVFACGASSFSAKIITASAGIIPINSPKKAVASLIDEIRQAADFEEGDFHAIKNVSACVSNNWSDNFEDVYKERCSAFNGVGPSFDAGVSRIAGSCQYVGFMSVPISKGISTKRFYFNLPKKAVSFSAPEKWREAIMGLKPIDSSLKIYPGTIYPMGASDSPDNAYIVSVDDKMITYKRFPYTPETHDGRIEKNIGLHLIKTALERKIAQLEAFVKDNPSYSDSSASKRLDVYKRMLAGEPVTDKGFFFKNPEDLARFDVTVKLKPGFVLDGQDPWYYAESFGPGNVSGLLDEGKYILHELNRQDIADVEADGGFEILEKKRKASKTNSEDSDSAAVSDIKNVISQFTGAFISADFSFKDGSKVSGHTATASFKDFKVFDNNAPDIGSLASRFVSAASAGVVSFPSLDCSLNDTPSAVVLSLLTTDPVYRPTFFQKIYAAEMKPRFAYSKARKAWRLVAAEDGPAKQSPSDVKAFFDTAMADGSLDPKDYPSFEAFLDAVDAYMYYDLIDSVDALPEGYDFREDVLPFAKEFYESHKTVSAAADFKQPDPTKEEMVSFLEKLFGSEVDRHDIEAAIYWFASDYHSGQNSNLYKALSSSEYFPGRLEKGVEKDSIESILYDHLVFEFTAESAPKQTTSASEAKLWVIKFKDGSSVTKGMSDSAKSAYEEKNRDKIESISEAKESNAAGMSRVLQHIDNAVSGKGSFAIFTASQSETVAGAPRSKSLNVSETYGDLGRILTNLKTGGIQLTGVWEAQGEPSWFVPNIGQDMAEALSQRYHQWAYIYAGPETDGKITLFASKDRGVSEPYMPVDTFASDVLSGSQFEEAEGYSALKPGSKSQRFSFKKEGESDEQAIERVAQWYRKFLGEKTAAAPKENGKAANSSKKYTGVKWYLEDAEKASDADGGRVTGNVSFKVKESEDYYPVIEFVFDVNENKLNSLGDSSSDVSNLDQFKPEIEDALKKHYAGQKAGSASKDKDKEARSSKENKSSAAAGSRYSVRKQGDKWVVWNKDTDKSEGESDTEELANAHMRALYAHMPEKDKKAAGSGKKVVLKNNPSAGIGIATLFPNGRYHVRFPDGSDGMFDKSDLVFDEAAIKELSGASKNCDAVFKSEAAGSANIRNDFEQRLYDEAEKRIESLLRYLSTEYTVNGFEDTEAVEAMNDVYKSNEGSIMKGGTTFSFWGSYFDDVVKKLFIRSLLKKESSPESSVSKPGNKIFSASKKAQAYPQKLFVVQNRRSEKTLSGVDPYEVATFLTQGKPYADTLRTSANLNIFADHKIVTLFSLGSEYIVADKTPEDEIATYLIYKIKPEEAVQFKEVLDKEKAKPSSEGEKKVGAAIRALAANQEESLKPWSFYRLTLEDGSTISRRIRADLDFVKQLWDKEPSSFNPVGEPIGYQKVVSIEPITETGEKLVSSASTQAAAAAAIKKELSQAFPGVKFFVKSSSFSGGNSVNVHWFDYPKTELVDAIINKYQYGSFDGMEDIYKDTNRREDIPQAKYVSSEHTWSDDANRKAVDIINHTYAEAVADPLVYGADSFWRRSVGGQHVGRVINNILSEFSSMEELDAYHKSVVGGSAPAAAPAPASVKAPVVTETAAPSVPAAAAPVVEKEPVPAPVAAPAVVHSPVYMYRNEATAGQKTTLQVKVDGEWHYVFCRNERTGLVLTDSPAKAVHGDENSLKYFQSKFGDYEFRIAKSVNEATAGQKTISSRITEEGLREYVRTNAVDLLPIEKAVLSAPDMAVSEYKDVLEVWSPSQNTGFVMAKHDFDTYKKGQIIRDVSQHDVAASKK